jgi:putative transposase
VPTHGKDQSNDNEDPGGVHQSSDGLTGMSTYTQIVYHIVFSTKGREQTLVATEREALFRYFWGLIRSRESRLYRINGTLDHVHILTSLHPSRSLADFVKEIKVGSSHWIKRNRVLTSFRGWQAGYAAFTHSKQDQERLIKYIKGQEKHHKKNSFEDELRNLLVESCVEFDDKYLLR